MAETKEAGAFLLKFTQSVLTTIINTAARFNSSKLNLLKIVNNLSFQVSKYNKVWYDAAPVGKNVLNDCMKNLSAKLNLTQPYTNHCVRATALTLLDSDGFEARHMAVSGHKNKSTIKSSYSVKCPPPEKMTDF